MSNYQARPFATHRCNRHFSQQVRQLMGVQSPHHTVPPTQNSPTAAPCPESKSHPCRGRRPYGSSWPCVPLPASSAACASGYLPPTRTIPPLVWIPGWPTASSARHPRRTAIANSTTASQLPTKNESSPPSESHRAGRCAENQDGDGSG